MSQKDVHLVTGALGYLGKYIAKGLIDKQLKVTTITNSPNRPNPFGEKLQIRSFNFDDRNKLEEAFEGVRVFYNTFWIRFPRGRHDFKWALDNSGRLIDAAVNAGVERIVHISVLNCDRDSNLEYYRSKAAVEKMITDSGISYCILRPAIVFGKEDVLINNIAWSLRHLPVMGIFGNGRYKIRPIHVQDLAELAIAQGQERGNSIIDALGPENVSFRELVEMVKNALAVKRLTVPVPVWIGYIVTKMLGLIKRDKFLTADEVRALISGKLASDGPARGQICLSRWISENADRLGRNYANEMARRRDRNKAYDSL